VCGIKEGKGRDRKTGEGLSPPVDIFLLPYSSLSSEYMLEQPFPLLPCPREEMAGLAGAEEDGQVDIITTTRKTFTSIAERLGGTFHIIKGARWLLALSLSIDGSLILERTR